MMSADKILLLFIIKAIILGMALGIYITVNYSIASIDTIINSTTGIEYTIVVQTIENATAISKGNGTWYPPAPLVNPISRSSEYLLQWFISKNYIEGIGNGTGSSYKPVPPVGNLSFGAEYLLQWLLENEVPNKGIGNGTGAWYPPIPPVNSLATNPEFLIQWVLPSNMGGGFPVLLNVSTNATKIYIGEPVAVNVYASTNFFGSALTGATVYVYDIHENGTVMEKTSLILKNGRANTTFTLIEPGNHTIYASFPRQGIYLSSRSNNITITVDKYPISLSILVNKTTVYYNESFPLTVQGVNAITRSPASGVGVTVFIVKNNSIVKTVKGQLGFNGKLVLQLNISTPGNYTLYAVSDETSFYRAAVSNNVTITIVYPANPMGGMPIVLQEHVIVLLLLAIAIDTSIIVVSRKRVRT